MNLVDNNNQNDLIKILEKAEVIYDAVFYEESEKEVSYFLNAFHVKEVYMLEKNDDYIGSIRANHFVLEVGTSEIKEGSFGILTANHKGLRKFAIYKLS